jgi:hypothetical protein
MRRYESLLQQNHFHSAFAARVQSDVPRRKKHQRECQKRQFTTHSTAFAENIVWSTILWEIKVYLHILWQSHRRLHKGYVEICEQFDQWDNKQWIVSIVEKPSNLSDVSQYGFTKIHLSVNESSQFYSLAVRREQEDLSAKGLLNWRKQISTLIVIQCAD